MPRSLHGPTLDLKAVTLPRDAYDLEHREFVLREALQAAEARLRTAEGPPRSHFSQPTLAAALSGTISSTIFFSHLRSLESDLAQAELLAAQLHVMQARRALEQRSGMPSGDAALQDQVIARQRDVAEARRDVLEARLAPFQTPPKPRNAIRDQLKRAEKALVKANEQLTKPLAKDLTKAVPPYPAQSTGRRLALAKWITDRQNPLAARVAVNHVWLRHFGQPLVPTVFDFGKNGQPPTHPALLDSLATRFMDDGWRLKKLHKLIVMSSTYRMDSTPESSALSRDPENRYYWRRLPQRMEAEVVRDALLHLAGRLDATRGGPELDHEAGQTTQRRSLYYRHANEKQMVFLTTFDVAGPTECYRRVHSVIPQQALALANSPVAQESSHTLARRLAADLGPQAPAASFVSACFVQILGRDPTKQEAGLCRQFLHDQENRLLTALSTKETITQRARASLVHVLFNHHEFVTVR